MIQIKSKSGTVRHAVTISEKAIYHKELMGEEYILLTFDTVDLITFQKGDYIETEFGRFEIYKIDKPKKNVNTGAGGYSYEQKFHAPWAKWENHVLFYDRQRGSEQSWKMTQLPQYFMQIVVDNIRDAGMGSYSVDIDPALSEMKLVEFDGTGIVSALTKIAEAWETEWWITDNVIHIAKCEYGDPIPFEVGNLIADMQRSDGQQNDYVTRLYAFGSARNLTTNYRKDESSPGVIEAVVERRLKLPEGTDHIDAWENLAPEDVVEGVAVFEDVYPRRVGTVGEVTTTTYTDEETQEDGTTEYKDWLAYRFTDSGIQFKSSYILPDTDLKIQFQTGKLAGMHFKVFFNPEELNEDEPGAQLWEVVRNEDYGVKLPNESFHPETGDKYVLYGFDIKMVEENYIALAEQELLGKATEYLAKKSKDTSVYTCPTNPIRCAGYIEVQGQLTHYADEEVDINLGQRVSLVSDNYFPVEGQRVSRIRAFDKHLDNKFNATYQVGETATYSTTKALNDKIEQLAMEGNQTITTGNGVYLIKRFDSTPPSDNNAYSALRSKREFISRLSEDIAQGHISFMEGLTALRKAFFDEGAHFGSYSSGQTGSGAAIDQLGNAEFESVKVRSYLEAVELIINRLSAIEGDQILTEADTIEDVEYLGTNGDGQPRYRLTFREKYDGYFTAQVEGNILKGIVNTLANAVLNGGEADQQTQPAEFYTSWMLVETVNAPANTCEVVLYTDEQTPAGKNFPPCPLMKVARWGNETDPQRQTCLYLSSTEGRIVRLTGVNSPIIGPGNIGFSLGRHPEFLDEMGLPLREGLDYIYVRGIVAQDFIQADHQGKAQPNYVERGQWDPSQTYYKEQTNPDTGLYETSWVWHRGCKYQCTQSHSEAHEPTWSSTYWAMIEGDPTFHVDFAEAEGIFDFDNFNTTLTIVATLHNQDITADILPGDVVWTRYSEDHTGTPRTTDDNLWAQGHANAGKQLSLTDADVGANGYMPRALRFTATVTLRDNENNEVATEQITIGY